MKKSEFEHICNVIYDYSYDLTNIEDDEIIKKNILSFSNTVFGIPELAYKFDSYGGYNHIYKQNIVGGIKSKILLFRNLLNSISRNKLRNFYDYELFMDTKGDKTIEDEITSAIQKFTEKYETVETPTQEIQKCTPNEIKEIFKAAEVKKQIKPTNTGANYRYIKEITQDIIDSDGLVIFDVQLLKRQNKILFIFIDKNNLKVYYVQNFEYSFFLSTISEGGAIQNDYYLNLSDNSDHIVKYYLTSFDFVNKLKYAINDSFNKTINLI